ncbi:MAG: hypothetical protein WCI22_17930, partial [Actinomycetota bacterium]
MDPRASALAVPRHTRHDAIEIIELVDADPNVFGGAPLTTVDNDRTPGESRAPRGATTAWLGGAAVALMLLGAAAVARQLRPWQAGDPAVVVRDASVTPTLTNHLVIGTVAGTPTGALTTTIDEQVGRIAFPRGAVFASGLAEAGSPSVKSAVFYESLSTTADNAFDPSATTTSVEVQGTAATLVSSGSSFLVRWKSADGNVYLLRTDRLDRAEALRLANALTIEGTSVRIRHRSALGALGVRGTLADAQRLGAVFEESQSVGNEQPLYGAGNDATMVVVRYPHAGMAVNTSVGPNTMALTESSFPVRAHVSVHGHDAIEVDTTVNFGSGESTRTTLMWTEGGRLIAVTA